MKAIVLSFGSDIVNDRFYAEIAVETPSPPKLQKDIILEGGPILADIEKLPNGQFILTLPVLSENIQVDAQKFLELLKRAIDEL